MQNQPIVKRVNEAHEWVHRPYQVLSAPYHCCLYKHKRQDERLPGQTADRCPFVHRHSKSQVTSFMGFPVVCEIWLALWQHCCWATGPIAKIQLGDNIMWHNVLIHILYCIQHCLDWDKTHSKFEFTKDSQRFWKTIYHVITTQHVILSFVLLTYGFQIFHIRGRINHHLICTKIWHKSISHRKRNNCHTLAIKRRVHFFYQYSKVRANDCIKYKAETKQTSYTRI